MIRKDIIEKFHPGIFIKDTIDEMNITQNEFAKRMGISDKVLSQLVNQEIKLTVKYAVKLGKMFGTNYEGWMSLQNSYDKYLLELKEIDDFEEEKEYKNY